MLQALLLATLLTAADVAAAESQVTLRYSGYWHALRILTVESTSATDSDRYRIEVTMRTEGVVDALFPWRSRTESVGVMRDDGPVPRRVRSEATFRRRTYRTALDYLDSGDVRATVEPAPEADGRGAVPEALRAATLDPQTATLALIRRNAAGRPCTGTEPVFDGRLRYDVELVDKGTAVLEASTYVRYPGPARICDAVIHPRAGFAHAERADGARTTLRYWFATVRAGIPPMPVRLDLSGRRGTLNFYLTEVSTPAS
jgi:hypothetical protein